ncbi:MAG: integrase arm-type DNA-binding domain-containing protein [Gammaproteobacteria bacterium]|nr:integrase arm-type DNA-binding domain-containing protein [Gammaproteobacteria bacterium]
MKLNNALIRNEKPDGAKTIKLFDGEGLFLQVTPKGKKGWRLKYRYHGKEKLLSLGVYPTVSLKQARKRKYEMRQLLTDGIDPSEHRKAVKKTARESAANSFEVIAREWFEKHRSNWIPTYAKKLMQRLENDLFPWLGQVPIATLTAQTILIVLQKVEARGAIETAHRLLSLCSQILRYASVTGRCERDITTDLRGALVPSKKKHLAEITQPEKVGELLRIIDGYQGTMVVKAALQLAPLVFVRPGELRTAQWDDIDFNKAEWRYTVTKTQTDHIVPLATQSVAILREIQPVTGNGQYVFPSARTNVRPMSDNAVLAALRRMGISKEEMSGHGFRAMARTILDEELSFRPDYIEHQLAHAVRDANGRAYNRTSHLAERKKMMQAWANYLYSLMQQTIAT